jgi:hypothetical protein
MSPVLFWTLALWKLKDDVLFWPFVALFAFVFLNTNFFIIGEYNVCYALSAFCLAMLLRRQASDFTDFALLMFAALVLTMTYAATMFIGPLLFGLCIKNAAQAETGRMRLYWLVLACPFLASIAVGFWDFLNPGIASNKEHALDPSALRNDRQFWLTGACAGLVFMQLMLRQKFARDALLLLVLAIEIINLTGVTNPTPFRCYSVRAFVGLSLAGLGFLMIVLRFGLWNWLSVKCRFKELPAHYYVIPIFILFAEMAIWDMRESLAYTQYIDDFTQIVDSNGGFIEHQNWSWRNANDPWFGWTWTYPSMSLVLRNSTHAAIILNPPYGVPEQIFDPHTNLPDLSRYY